MTKVTWLIFLFCFLTKAGFSQTDSSSNNISSGIYERIIKAVNEFTLDTSASPDDNIKRKILELRNLRGNFNINEVVAFKIEEERNKKEIPKVELDSLSNFFNYGNGKKWLDNAMIWMYRRHFTYRELKQMVKFYRTPAGKKMSFEFPLIIMESLKTAELIKEIYSKQKREL